MNYLGAIVLPALALFIAVDIIIAVRVLFHLFTDNKEKSCVAASSSC